MLHIFPNNTSTDFRTANKQIFIPSCYSSDLTEPKYQKTKLNELYQLICINYIIGLSELPNQH